MLSETSEDSERSAESLAISEKEPATQAAHCTIHISIESYAPSEASEGSEIARLLAERSEFSEHSELSDSTPRVDHSQLGVSTEVISGT